MALAEKLVAGPSGDFPEGKIIAKRIAGKDVILIRRQGVVQCYVDECTHQPVKLSEFGEVVGGHLVCHAHGGTFDLDNKGKVICDPPYDALTGFICDEVSGQVSVFI